MKRAYIAGPISRGCLRHNVDQATRAFVRLAQAGLSPFAPQWSVYSKPTTKLFADHEVWCLATVMGNDHLSHDDWLAIDLCWVEVSDVVLRLPGLSMGADAEVAHARAKGIPIYYDIDQLIADFQKGEYECSHKSISCAG